MTAPIELLPPGTGPHDERWHQARRAGVTASEIAVVMGLSPYNSPFNLYWEKVNDWRWEGNEYTRAGQHLESAIAEWWEVEHGGEPWDSPIRLRLAGLYAHPDRPWQLATPDRLVKRCYPDRPGVFRLTDLLEVKWVAHSWDGWGEPGSDEVPVHYRCQALWQLDVMGVDEVHFAALGPGGFRSYVVRRDEADLELMRKAGEDFVRQLREGNPPDLDSHTATLGALKKLYPLGDGDVQVSVDLAERYRKARAAKAAAEVALDACEAEIRAALGGDHNRAVVGHKLVASRSVFERKAYEVKATTIDKLNPGRADSYA